MKAQDETAAKDAEETPAPDDTTPATEKSPSDDESAGEKPSAEPTDKAEPSPTPEASASASEEPSESDSATPSVTASPSKNGRVVAQVVPQPTGNNAVITVKVGGNRTTQTAVGALAGVQLGLYTTADGTTPVAGFGTCTSDADGDCSFTVPNTQFGGANRDVRYWVKRITGTTAPGYYTNPHWGPAPRSRPISTGSRPPPSSAAAPCTPRARTS